MTRTQGKPQSFGKFDSFQTNNILKERHVSRFCLQKVQTSCSFSSHVQVKNWMACAFSRSLVVHCWCFGICLLKNNIVFLSFVKTKYFLAQLFKLSKARISRVGGCTDAPKSTKAPSGPNGTPCESFFTSGWRAQSVE